MPNISSVIKAIQDIMRKDTGVDGDAQRLSQIVWMLFLKIFADKEVEAEIIDDNYKSPIAEKYRWQTWAKDDEGEIIETDEYKDLSTKLKQAKELCENNINKFYN